MSWVVSRHIQIIANREIMVNGAGKAAKEVFRQLISEMPQISNVLSAILRKSSFISFHPKLFRRLARLAMSAFS